MAAARKRRDVSEVAALIAEVFTGRPAPALPACVTAALDEFDAGRLPPPAVTVGELHPR